MRINEIINIIIIFFHENHTQTHTKSTMVSPFTLSAKSDNTKVTKVKLYEPTEHVAFADDLKGDSTKVGGGALDQDMNRALRWGDESLGSFS